jgi:acetyl esterase/lipase
MTIRTLLLSLSFLAAQDSRVRELKDLAYYEGEGADEKKHKLNLFLPDSDKPFPVVMFIHGGAWTMGDRALYSALGQRFAERGIGLAAISYRLTPAVRHPEHAKDCARAFAWLHRNVATHGGDPKRLFVMGHSAGGHLSALLALDSKYLDELKVPAGSIQGAVPISGAYVIPALGKEGAGPLRVLADAFGTDPDVCRDASPASHAKNLKCPMLVLTETDDNLRLRPSMKLFQAAFEKEGVRNVEFVDAEDRNHSTIVGRMMARGDDPNRDRIVEFVRRVCKDLDGR